MTAHGMIIVAALTVVGWIIAAALIVVWALSIADIVRRHYSGWTTAGWVALVLILPVVGSLIYWALRKPTQAETSERALAEADRRRRPFDGTGSGMGPH